MTEHLAETHSRIAILLVLCERELAVIEDINDERLNLITASIRRFALDLRSALQGSTVAAAGDNAEA